MKTCFNKMMSLEHMSYLPERQQDDYFCTTKSQFVIGSKSVHLFCRDPNKLCVSAMSTCFTVFSVVLNGWRNLVYGGIYSYS